MVKVLLLEGHTVEVLPVLKSLKRLNCHSTVLCDSKMSYGYFSKYPDATFIKAPLKYQSQEFLPIFESFLKENPVDIIIPLYDPSAEFLSKNKQNLKNHAAFAVPDYSTFIRGFHKNQLMDLCRDNGVAHPRTFRLTSSNVFEAMEYVGLPAIIKPNITSGGRGICFVDSREDIGAKLSGVEKSFGSCTLQEFIPSGGRQYKVELFRTFNGRIVGSSVIEKIRFYPPTGGSSCCNRTIDDPTLVSVCSSVLDLLDWEGFADFDLIEDPRDGQVKVMEINPRFPACVRASFLSGVDFAEIYLDYCLGNDVKSYKYNAGAYLRYLGLDILWFIKSSNRFKIRPTWFRFFGRDVYYQEGSLDDPLPFIFGNLGAIKKLLIPEFRKSKSGLVVKN